MRTATRTTFLALASAAAIAIPFLGAATADAAPGSPTMKTVDATSSAPVATGKFTGKGLQDLQVNAEGTSNFAPPCGSYCDATPDGNVDALACNSDCTAPGLPVGSLIGKLGVNGKWFEIGSNDLVVGTGTKAGKGQQLFIAYNDDYFADNSGSYTVTITPVAHNAG